jgi:membrane-bound serine protease (ClpP class)
MGLYLFLLVLGLILFGLEIFVPGGILGAIGGVLLIGAMIAGFSPEVFGSNGGMLSAILILVGVCLYTMLLIRYLPQSPVGRMFTLSHDMKGSKASLSEQSDLVGATGVAHTDLRPSGIATIGGRRVDVITDSQWISHGAAIKVLKVDGGRVLVREIEA